MPRINRIDNCVEEAIEGRPRRFCGAYQSSGKRTHNAALPGPMNSHGFLDIIS